MLDDIKKGAIVQSWQAITQASNKGNNMQEILKQAQEQQQRTMKREALVCNIICTVLGLFTLSALVPWFFIG